MTERQTVSLGWPPEDPQRLKAFPRYSLGSEVELFRVVRQGRGPWWFGSRGDGRFDLPKPAGTCYLANDELSALLEVIGPERTGGAISARFFFARHLCHLRVPRTCELADLTSRRSAGFGITLEIHSMVPYDRPQAWALGLRRAGAQGLLYWVRHDPAGGRGIALFGRHGPKDFWPTGSTLTIAPALLERLREACGVEVLEIPRLGELQIVDAPIRQTP